MVRRSNVLPFRLPHRSRAVTQTESGIELSDSVLQAIDVLVDEMRRNRGRRLEESGAKPQPAKCSVVEFQQRRRTRSARRGGLR